MAELCRYIKILLRDIVPELCRDTITLCQDIKTPGRDQPLLRHGNLGRDRKTSCRDNSLSRRYRDSALESLSR